MLCCAPRASSGRVASIRKNSSQRGRGKPFAPTCGVDPVGDLTGTLHHEAGNRTVCLGRGQGFTIHCLYNQETAENPQLYFSHQLKIGDALQLAQQIRKGLDQTNSPGSQAATPPSGGANTGAWGTAGGRPLGELAGGIAALAAALLAGAAVIRRRSTNHT